MLQIKKNLIRRLEFEANSSSKWNKHERCICKNQSAGARPDNVILLVDGLPTMNKFESNRGMITGQERLNLYYEAENEIPSGIPVNILLYPMEGDYNASIVYWLLHIEQAVHS